MSAADDDLPYFGSCPLCGKTAGNPQQRIAIAALEELLLAAERLAEAVDNFKEIGAASGAQRARYEELTRELKEMSRRYGWIECPGELTPPKVIR